MFAVLTAHGVPDHMQGYLSRFLTEVEAGVYVGVSSPAVIDRIWQRLLETLPDGAFVLVRSAPQTEQGFTVECNGVADTAVYDFDGLALVSRREGFDTGRIDFVSMRQEAQGGDGPNFQI